MSRVSPSNRIQGRTTTNLVKESGPLPLCPSYRGPASVLPLLPSPVLDNPLPPHRLRLPAAQVVYLDLSEITYHRKIKLEGPAPAPGGEAAVIVSIPPAPAAFRSCYNVLPLPTLARTRILSRS